MTISPTTKRYLPWVFAVLAGLSLAVAFWFAPGEVGGWQLAVTLLAASGAFVHFLYSRHLDEIRLFHELFKEFNARYDSKNEGLNEILNRSDATDLSPSDRQKLFDYFNLCAEEFFYYRCGYIPEDVWVVWRRGMRIFLGAPKVRELLEAELRTGSYYGLTIDEIQKG